MPGYIQFTIPVQNRFVSNISIPLLSMKKPLFSNNSMVYYKNHSQSTGVGTVRNASRISHRT